MYKTITVNVCKVRPNGIDNELLPRTLSKENLPIPANVEHAFIWVETETHDEIFCIQLNGEWHEAQSIDFDF